MTTLPPGTSVGRRRSPAFGIGLVLLVLAVGFGGWFLITRVLLRDNVDVTAQGSAADATSVNLTVDNADVTVTPSADDQVRMHVTGSYSASTPTVRVDPVNAGVIQATAVCSQQWLAYCSIEVTLEVPARMDLVVSDDNGDLSVSDITGDLNLTSDNGDLEITGAEGALSVQSDNGAIDIQRSSSTQVKAETNNGAVTVELTAVPLSVEARTNNGNVEIRVPGSEKYIVVTDTDNGTVKVEVGVDTDSTHHITAVSDNGDVTVRPAA